MNKRKIVTWALIVMVLLGVTLAGYFSTQKFLSDRQSMMIDHPNREIHKFANNNSTKRTYTPEEVEQMRKKGTLPNNLKQPYTPPNAAGDAAVQQSLRTLQEINKINEMNQRLMDQQRRVQDQNQRR